MQNLLQHRLKLINKSKAIFIKLLFFSFSIMFFTTARAQTGQALNFDGINDYVSLPFAINGDYTKEAWINLASTSGASNIVSGNNTYFYVTAGGILTAGQSGSIAVVSDVTALVPGIWYHVAVTFNATSGAMNLYKNGAVVSSGVAPAYIEPVLEIGRFSSANYFNGTMDEVRVWSTERSVSEIPASKDCELTGDEPGLLAYYKFNQGTAGANNSSITTIADSSDKCNVFNGTLNNFTLMTGTSNFIAPGAPVSGTCANFFSNINLTGNNNCIVNGDVTPSLTDFTDFGSYGSSPISRTFVIQNTGNTALNITSVTITGVNASDFSFAAPASTVAAGGFTNLVVTFSPTGANGIKNATITINNDDVDEGTFTFNITGNFAGPGKALAFDGIDDRVDLPFNISGDYTKEAWINTNTASGAQNIVTGTNTYFYVNGGFLTAGQGGSFAVVTDGTALVPNTWYQVAVTYNATSGVMSLYKDGALVASNPAPAYTETPLQIGAFGGSSNFSGTIDEVRIWNVEKTVGQIMAFKNCELNGAEANLIAYYNFNEGINGGDNTGLTTLNDLHGNCPLNGKLVNFALTGNTSNWVAPGGTLPGSCTAQVPNISVAGNGNCIIIGDATPDVTDNTDFGMTGITTTNDHTFIIHNNGGATLTIASVILSGVDASSFSILTAPALLVLPGDSTSFVVRFAPTTNGVKNAIVTVVNDDIDEAAYSYAIQGTAFTILPVTVLSFKAVATGKITKLFWETATEINNAGFEIQRSIDGNTRWETIGFVKATNFANGSKYSFNDLAPLRGLNAYRLKQIDIDGRFTNSNTELVNFSGDATIISISPNPAKDKLNVIFNDKKLLNTQAKIRSASGALVATVTLNNYHQPIDISNLPGGLYFITFFDGSVQRIIKQ